MDLTKVTELPIKVLFEELQSIGFLTETHSFYELWQNKIAENPNHIVLIDWMEEKPNVGKNFIIEGTYKVWYQDEDIYDLT